jgi:hypothetical protein
LRKQPARHFSKKQEKAGTSLLWIEKKEHTLLLLSVESGACKKKKKDVEFTPAF